MKTVLLIDDNVTGVRPRAALLKAFGYKPVIALTGSEGVDMAATQAADAVVLDHLLPDMAGAQVLEVLRRDQPDLPVTVLSGMLDLPESITNTAAAVVMKGDGAQRLLDALAASLHESGE